MTHRLAIVIPAYKATFLPAALDSIAIQTCKEFTLYVGDDCSPEPIGSIVEQYKDKVNLVYQRFDTNLGGKDLVAQWGRCIAMSREEPYIWLFSDDDVMEPNCVEELLRQIEKTEGYYDVYHFNVDIINERRMCSHEKSMNKWTASRNMTWHGAAMWQRGLCSLAERVCVLCPMQGYAGGKVRRISPPIIHAK